MSTYLELCQDVARESGTVAGGVRPITVTSQTGRLLKVTKWTAEAWVRVQNLHSAWRWMQKTYTGSLTSGTSTYTPASFAITDLRDWIRDSPTHVYFPHTIYLTATGVSDERSLTEISWHAWRTMYGRGTQTNSFPMNYAITPAGAIAFGSIPDAPYTVNGEFAQAAVRMTADGDTPGLPDAFHQIIVNQALILLNENDEAIESVVFAKQNYAQLLFDLELSQLPKIQFGNWPIA